MGRTGVAAMACAAALLVSCGKIRNDQNKNDMESKNLNTAVFSRGERGPADWFSGTTWVRSLVAPQQVEGLYSVGQVTFSAGARTLWHTHPAGQVLLVTAGRGFYQERGKAARPLAPGDVVVIPKDVEHWHGAAKDCELVHIAVSNVRDGSSVAWTVPVTGEEYDEVNR